MNSRKIPAWVWALIGLVLAAQILAFGMTAAGVLKGPSRNLSLQVFAAGGVVLLAVLAYLLLIYPDRFPQRSAHAGVLFLAIVASGLVCVYFASIRSLLAMPYDIACWSEPMMVVDIIKLRIGQALYQPASDSNSNTYTFLAPSLTYFLAWFFRHPDSITAYRWIQQIYLVVASVLSASSAMNLVRLAAPEHEIRPRRAWFVFFAATLFLFATNDVTNFFNVYLHNDAIALLVTTIAFWLMVKHARTSNARWLWIMALIPSVGFLAKQYLGIWLVIYALYLWLQNRQAVRRLAVFCIASGGLLAATVGACFALMGAPFRYWVFGALREIVLAQVRVVQLYEASGLYLALGAIGVLVLVRGKAFERLLGIAMAWFVLLVTGFYTSGVSYHPSHLGSSTMIAVCFFLAAVAKLWPMDVDVFPESRAQHFLQASLSCMAIICLLAGLHFTQGRRHVVSQDLTRYVHAIEGEFQGQPIERVLLDEGDWFYLRHGVLMKDRATLLTNQFTTTHLGIFDRIRTQYYSRILVHRMTGGELSYDLGGDRGVGRDLERFYRRVRRIPSVEGMENWNYHNIMMGEIDVYEPIAPGAAMQPVSAPPPS